MKFKHENHACMNAMLEQTEYFNRERENLREILLHMHIFD